METLMSVNHTVNLKVNIGSWGTFRCAPRNLPSNSTRILRKPRELYSVTKKKNSQVVFGFLDSCLILDLLLDRCLTREVLSGEGISKTVDFEQSIKIGCTAT